MAKIFISYSRADRQFVDEFVPLLRQVYGSGSTWFDEQIYGGSDWWQMILSQIARCELFVYLVSNEALESSYCQAEFREALRLRKRILPVIVRPKTNYPGNVAADLRPILKRTQFIDMSRGFRNAQHMASLYAAMNRLLGGGSGQTQPPLHPTPVSSPSVADTRTGGGGLTESRAIIMAAVITGIFAIIVAVMMTGGGDNSGDGVGVSVTTAVGMDDDTPTATDTSTELPTNTPTDTPTNTATNRPTDTPTNTITPSHTPTDFIVRPLYLCPVRDDFEVEDKILISLDFDRLSELVADIVVVPPRLSDGSAVYYSTGDVDFEDDEISVEIDYPMSAGVEAIALDIENQLVDYPQLIVEPVSVWSDELDQHLVTSQLAGDAPMFYLRFGGCLP